MAKVEHYYTKFEENKFYHIYNRCIDKKLMFKNEGNYYFFLKRFSHYSSPVLQTFAYCLLGNHFHLLVRIRSQHDLNEFRNLNNLNNNLSVHDLVSRQFRKFFQSYAMAFNKEQSRIGTLFQTPFKRACVENEKYLKKLICYIHTNPQHHGITSDFRTWKWHTYHQIMMNNLVELEYQEILYIFGGIGDFEKYHLEKSAERRALMQKV